MHTTIRSLVFPIAVLVACDSNPQPRRGPGGERSQAAGAERDEPTGSEVDGEGCPVGSEGEGEGEGEGEEERDGDGECGNGRFPWPGMGGDVICARSPRAPATVAGGQALDPDCIEAAPIPTGDPGPGNGRGPLRGRLAPFWKARVPVDLCVAALDYALLLNSDCAALPSEAQQECFSVDLCEDPSALGAGVVLGTVFSTPNLDDDESAWFGFDDLPTGRDLVIRVSGDPREWIDTYNYGHGQERAVFVIGKSSWQTLPATAMVPRGIQEGRGMVVGTVRDCLDRPVTGATAGTSVAKTTIAYFQGVEGDNLPLPGGTSTNSLGVFAVINAEAGLFDLVTLVHDGEAVVPAGFARLLLPPGALVVYDPARSQ